MTVLCEVRTAPYRTPLISFPLSVIPRRATANTVPHSRCSLRHRFLLTLPFLLLFSQLEKRSPFIIIIIIASRWAAAASSEIP
jgi:hypothetical protein